VRLIAPRALFLFVPFRSTPATGGGVIETDLLEALNRFLVAQSTEASKADILLISYGPLPGRAAYEAAFAPQDKSYVWAPGEDIPVRLSSAETAARRGNTLTAGIVGGVVARLVDRKHDIALDEVVRIL
jgi:hypothetical protein